LFIENTGVRIPTFRDIGRIRKRFLNWKNGVHGIRKIEDGLYVYAPLVLPFPYSRIARFVNRKMMFSILFRWLRAVGFRAPVIWTFLPTGLGLDLINSLEPKAVIYYCIDSFTASSASAARIQDTERRTIEKADLVFATSEQLVKYCSRFNPNVHFFPFGVNIDNFDRGVGAEGAPPDDMRGIPRPIAGYIGGIHKWIDLDLVYACARAHPEVSFVFCGPLQSDVARFKTVNNVHFLGQKKTEELPRYVRLFDVGLIPYVLSDYTNNVYPTKLNEYLAMGKRVVSTALPEVERFNSMHGNIVAVERTCEGFSRAVGAAVKRPLAPKEAEGIVSIARKNSWASRLDEMSLLIENVIEQKEREKEEQWKVNLKRLYTDVLRKAAPVAVAAAVVYGALFYTPLVSVMARPLFRADVPAKADVIVALGGGVGELGKVGQGHEERVDTAVHLYREGYADKLLYLSGYRYVMKEAEVMKALSVFLGVPERSIVIDDKPVNTHEMALSVDKFLSKNGWKSAILISSPYHMARLRMVCRKVMPDIKVYCVPVRESAWDPAKGRVTWYQINLVLREYAAIGYYRLKGYL
ncbi:MAG: ElyC/SanA/YdcF family protein, partial [Candidatus Omnitrophica bacterium]|nr:ElyC/SanA/YdcF family protein [Candidatus Omnitrophota bacterium]